MIEVIPGAAAVQPPFFLLPILWGLWNLLWTRRQPAMSAGRWGALLGVLAGVVVNLLFVAEGGWFRAAMLLPLFLAVVYYLIWRVVIGPLNEALGVDGESVALQRDAMHQPPVTVVVVHRVVLHTAVVPQRHRAHLP